MENKRIIKIPSPLTILKYLSKLEIKKNIFDLLSDIYKRST